MDQLGLKKLAVDRTWRGVVALSYHRIAAGSAEPPSYACATAVTLQEQLRLLRTHCDVLSPSQLDEQSLTQPGRRVLVTVDDCYRDSYEVAFPLFQANGIRAAFFLVSGFVDGTATPWWDEIAWMVDTSKRERLDPSDWWQMSLPLKGTGAKETVNRLVRLRRGLSPARGEDMLDQLGVATGSGRMPPECTGDEFLTWDMAREMAAAGMVFGGHTHTHPVLATLPEQDQHAEIERGLRRIESELGARPTTFAYPVGLQGTFGAATKTALTAAGVTLAFSNYGGYTRQSNWDPLEIRRVGVSQATSEPSFRWTVGLPAVFAREWGPGQFQLNTSD